MKKIALVLSGCGHLDGAEITESVSTIIALTELGAQVSCFAPDLDFTPTNFLTRQPETITRNVMQEAARISRGEIHPLEALVAKDFEALVFPGGFGVALHLCDWAKKGSACQVLPAVKTVIEGFYNQQKPIGAICIAPALIAKVLGHHGVQLTIGKDSETAQEIQKTGAKHVDCPVEDFVTDRAHRIVSTPAYMYGNAKPYQVFRGIRGLVQELYNMA
jgi:enhancing lycopene biosynthesis protein 2